LSEAEKAREKAGARRTALWMLGILLIGGLLSGTAVVLILRHQLLQQEMLTIGSLRTYCNAQIMSRPGDWDTDEILTFAHPYTQLYGKPDRAGQKLPLICAAFAAARGPRGKPYRGYLFKDMKTIYGKPINWAVDYGLCATPAQYGRTGRRTFIVVTDGVVWSKDLGESRFIADFPADPAAEGWENTEIAE
jgi:hypothetical protein